MHERLTGLTITVVHVRLTVGFIAMRFALGTPDF